VISDVEKKLEEKEKDLHSFPSKVAQARKSRAEKRESMTKFKTIDNLQETITPFSPFEEEAVLEEDSDKPRKKETTKKKKAPTLRSGLTKKL